MGCSQIRPRVLRGWHGPIVVTENSSAWIAYAMGLRRALCSTCSGCSFMRWLRPSAHKR